MNLGSVMTTFFSSRGDGSGSPWIFCIIGIVIQLNADSPSCLPSHAHLRAKNNMICIE